MRRGRLPARSNRTIYPHESIPRKLLPPTQYRSLARTHTKALVGTCRREAAVIDPTERDFLRGELIALNRQLDNVVDLSSVKCRSGTAGDDVANSVDRIIAKAVLVTQ